MFLYLFVFPDIGIDFLLFPKYPLAFVIFFLFAPLVQTDIQLRYSSMTQLTTSAPHTPSYLLLKYSCRCYFSFSSV